MTIQRLGPPELVELFGFLDRDPLLNVYVLALTLARKRSAPPSIHTQVEPSRASSPTRRAYPVASPERGSSSSSSARSTAPLSNSAS